jgi:hypothetical protein
MNGCRIENSVTAAKRAFFCNSSKLKKVKDILKKLIIVHKQSTQEADIFVYSILKLLCQITDQLLIDSKLIGILKNIIFYELKQPLYQITLPTHRYDFNGQSFNELQF